MRTIDVSKITDAVRKLCIEANYFLPDDIKNRFDTALNEETFPIAKNFIKILKENADVAAKENMPICQDTGMAIVFIELGQDVHIVGGSIEEAVNEGVRCGYVDGYLRKSVVGDPLERVNTNDNTPAIIHYEIIPGDGLTITLSPKGYGSENMSRIRMLKPSDGVEGVVQFILDSVREAGPNPCPPIIVGVGIGGSFEKAAYLAKKSLLRPIDSRNPIEYYANLENDILTAINGLGIGPQGFGGLTTALAVNIETYATHIAGLPVAVNISCHATRHKVAQL
ncbi:fumarate hydratase [Youngiibacter multivorans]|uniref:Fumarate hydratase subunit alpha n=1 Tax=Youngiibacter multivorans TaxID=937251 RepID=A0ABS4G6D1_9CLOT|nr:fumarate hydratase [Youngiibacter multivorans]MBP1920140.1 fumarate hydratase subunit alpha [Youngiibacter multivorans]